MSTLNEFSPLHGGNVAQAAKHFSIPQSQWLDLSTGMNATPYPVPALSSEAFHHLPYLTDSFCHAATSYYGHEKFLATPGSQSIIQALPKLLNASSKLPVLLPRTGYQEHQDQWLLAEQEVQYYSSFSADDIACDIERCIKINSAQHIVLINPNNPTGSKTSIEKIVLWSKLLTEGAYVIVDEAFIDNTPELSLLSLEVLPDNIIVLRSFGKFFGLAGIRLGFVFANKRILSELEKCLGLWAVNGPAQEIASKALLDIQWHEDAKKKLSKDIVTTKRLLAPLWEKFTLLGQYSTDFFVSNMLTNEQAIVCFNHFAQRGVLTRVIRCDSDNSLLRIACLDSNSDNDVMKLNDAIQQAIAITDIELL